MILYSFAILEFHSLNHLGQQLVAPEASPLSLPAMESEAKAGSPR